MEENRGICRRLFVRQFDLVRTAERPTKIIWIPLKKIAGSFKCFDYQNEIIQERVRLCNSIYFFFISNPNLDLVWASKYILTKYGHGMAETSGLNFFG